MPRRARLRRFLRRSRRLAITLGIALAVACTVLVLAGAALSRQSPSWWRRIDPASPEAAEAARRLENDAGSEFTRPRASDPAESADGTPRSAPWSVAIDDLTASRWLATRLPDWLRAEANLADWPDELRDLQVRFTPSDIHVGVRVGGGGRSAGKVLSVTLRPELVNDALWLRATWVHVGRMPLPAGAVLGSAADRAAEALPEVMVRLPETADFFKILAGARALADPAAHELPDDRTIRIRRVRLGDGWIEVTCQTEGRRVPTHTPAP